MLNEKDLKQIRDRGSDPETVEKQLKTFREGFPYMDLRAAATPDSGIKKLSEEEINNKLKVYENSRMHQEILKFVPASGAASRMFKTLAAFEADYQHKPGEQQQAGLEQNADVKQFFEELGKFPFFEDLHETLKEHGEALHDLIDQKDYARVLYYFLKPEGLGYEQLPKGLLKFHKYNETVRTAFEEHLVEGAYYNASAGRVPLHFTVSPEHHDMFRDLQLSVQPQYEDWLKVRYGIGYSYQDPSTDTIAVDMNNEPFRDEEGNLVFRPGGHGALLDNLNKQDADIIFIKNIDNVVPDRLKEPTCEYKKLLGGILLAYQQKIFAYLKQIESKDAVDEALLKEVQVFLSDDLCVKPPEDYDQWSFEEQWHYCYQKLNRPLRVCGMVKNEGEPGGGPFWAKNQDGSVSLQIVEKDQINFDDPDQKSIVDASTHFNPVDIVCSTKNFKGQHFHLPEFRDDNTGFISQKSKNGRDLKALELPGLWNGAMADWNTIFVELPIVTFNPVKTILDLLRKNHQAELKEAERDQV